MRRMKIREASKVVNNSEAFHSDIQFWSMFELPLLSLLVTDWRHICPTMLGLSRIVRLHVSPFKRRLLAYYLRTHGETCAECRTVILIRAQIYILFISFITFHFHQLSAVCDLYSRRAGDNKLFFSAGICILPPGRIGARDEAFRTQRRGIRMIGKGA